MSDTTYIIKTLQELNEKELKAIRLSEPYIDELMIEIYKLVNLDKVRIKAVRRNHSKTLKKLKLKPNSNLPKIKILLFL
uniref:Uncharacterized protein n=1 Tax=viral metagenome TaxID=1070528 RepID=A0A6C0J9F5_9ZZZZ